MDLIGFDERRKLDPQGVIDDLLRQITRQAVAIHEKNKLLKLAENDGITPLGELGLKTKLRSKKAKSDTIAPDVDNATPDEES